jgi:ribosome biogenesis protein NSA1
MRKSIHNENSSNLFATGGKENDLKVWNLSSNAKDPVFRAKNVADNWIQLREPVCITAIDFIDQNRVVVGTAFHQIRVYDIKSGIRRPMFNLTFGQHPISTISIVPGDLK